MTTTQPAIRTFTASEEEVIKLFFTIEDVSILHNDDKVRVYCKRDRLPMAIWPFLIGGYSRSQDPLAVRWLNAIKEADPENYERNLETIASASSSQSGTDLLNPIFERVEKFLHVWAVSYGHNSLKDSAIDCFAVECISQRATKTVEDAQLAAFQEKSTRYVDFSNPSFEDCGNVAIRDLNERAMQLYDKILPYVKGYYAEQFKERNDFVSERAKQNTINAKAFDVARYCLPIGVRTSLGITSNTRETERLIQKLLADDLPEIRLIGEEMKKHGSIINPGLLKHTEANSYSVRRKYRVCESSPIRHTPAGATLLECDEAGIKNRIYRALRYNVPVLRTYQTCVDDALANRGKHDELPVEFKQGELAFEIVLDLGAFRDLQRHRVGTQIIHGFHPLNGFTTPSIIANSEFADEYEKLMLDYMHVALENTDHADYCLTMAHHIRYMYICDIKQMFYITELRTGPSGHWSYRSICQQMARQFLEKFPEFVKHLRIDWSVEADRSSAENSAELKKSKASEALNIK